MKPSSTTIWPKPAFQDLTPGEMAWISDQLSLAVAFAGGSASDELPSLDQFDAAFAQFVESDAPEQANAVIWMLGVALGTHLIRGLGFEWVVATDDYGTDLAILARRGRGDLTMYPFDFVTKRWERRETWFLAAVPDQVSETLAESDRNWSAHDA